MRRAAKVDATQQAIVSALRAAGCAVLSLAAVGGGCPDVLVARRGWTWLMEVKRPPGKRGGTSDNGQRLSELQAAWHARWPAPVHVVRTADEALAVVEGRALTPPVPPEYRARAREAAPELARVRETTAERVKRLARSASYRRADR